MPKRFVTLLVVILAACNLNRPTAIAPPDTRGSDGVLTVAWADNGDLMVWRAGDEAPPRRIASGGVIQPYLAPDGEHVVFTRGPQGQPETFWVVDFLGTAEQELVDAGDVRVLSGGQPLIGDVRWFDESALYFNTVHAFEHGVEAQNDLYRANVRTREVALILPRTEGGQFAISPDREHIAVVYPGTYGRQDGRISVIDPLALEPARNLLFFVGVSTGSEFGFYPTIHWRRDSSSVLVAVPDKDLVYDDINSPPVTLWELPVDVPSNRAIIGSVPATFFALPGWSSRGEHVVYMQRVGQVTSNEFELHLASADGSDTEVYASGQASTISAPQWIAGTDTFVYVQGNPGEYWLAGPGLAPQRLPNGSETMFLPRFLDGTVYVFVRDAEESPQLRYARLDQIDSPSSLIAPLSGLSPGFDAVLVPQQEA